MNRKCQFFEGMQPCPKKRGGSVYLDSFSCIMGCRRRARGAQADSSWERWKEAK